MGFKGLFGTSILQKYEFSSFFIRFLEELKTPKSPFEINWPLVLFQNQIWQRNIFINHK